MIDNADIDYENAHFSSSQKAPLPANQPITVIEANGLHYHYRRHAVPYPLQH